MTQMQQYIKTSEDRYFRDLYAVVSDQLLLIGDKEYDLASIASSEVVAEPGTRNWPMYLKSQVGPVIGIVVVFVLASYLSWSFVWIVMTILVIQTIKDIWREFHNPVQYSLLLNTDAGPIKLASNKTGVGLSPLALEINKRITMRRYSGPLLPTQASPQQLQSGEPTRRIMAK